MSNHNGDRRDEKPDRLLDLVRTCRGHTPARVALDVSLLPEPDRLQLFAILAALLLQQRQADVLRVLTGPDRLSGPREAAERPSAGRDPQTGALEA